MKSSLKAGVEKPSEWVSAASMTGAVYKSAARRSTSHFLTAWPRGAHWGYHQLILTTVCIARMTIVIMAVFTRGGDGNKSKIIGICGLDPIIEVRCP